MSNWVKRTISLFTGLILVLGLTAAPAVNAAESPKKVKNVIVMIPDGMSVTGTTLARWYLGGTTPLALDEMASGLVKTYWAAGAITDSAPAGTAMATGYKTTNKFIGVLPDKADMPGVAAVKEENKRKPVATVLEAANLNGKATGLVATSNIQHATPAAYSSHYPDRSQYEILGEQQVYNNMTAVLGSGYQYLMGDKRKDKEDLIKVLKDRGYDYVTTPEEMKKSAGNKIWAMFAPDAMAYDFDRDASKEPSLAEMTRKAIDVLSKDKDGFFLMVEGSKVDWAAHANDPVGLVSDIMAFDAAVKVALDYAKKDGNTVVVSATDHGNGGITIGNTATTKTYDNDPLSKFMDQLKKAKLTGEGIEKKLNSDKSNIKEVVAEFYGIIDLTAEEVDAIAKAKAGSMNSVVGPMISKRANLGWTTGGHTGEDVVLYAYHPKNEYKLSGVIDNTDIAKYTAEVLGLDLEDATKKLFVPVKTAFEAKGAKVTWDETDVNNPVVVVTKGNTTLKLPVNKSEAILDGKTVQLNGVTVYNGLTSYVPQQAVDLIK
ncbi:MAG: alkaline phosphatase [Clostridia bacterium]|nr:alkaline phosphatase [Clostridia bacterium]